MAGPESLSTTNAAAFQSSTTSLTTGTTVGHTTTSPSQGMTASTNPPPNSTTVNTASAAQAVISSTPPPPQPKHIIPGGTPGQLTLTNVPTGAAGIGGAMQAGAAGAIQLNPVNANANANTVTLTPITKNTINAIKDKVDKDLKWTVGRALMTAFKVIALCTPLGWTAALTLMQLTDGTLSGSYIKPDAIRKLSQLKETLSNDKSADKHLSRVQNDILNNLASPTNLFDQNGSLNDEGRKVLVKLGADPDLYEYLNPHSHINNEINKKQTQIDEKETEKARPGNSAAEIDAIGKRIDALKTELNNLQDGHEETLNNVLDKYGCQMQPRAQRTTGPRAPVQGNVPAVGGHVPQPPTGPTSIIFTPVNNPLQAANGANPAAATTTTTPSPAATTTTSTPAATTATSTTAPFTPTPMTVISPPTNTEEPEPPVLTDEVPNADEWVRRFIE